MTGNTQMCEINCPVQLSILPLKGISTSKFFHTYMYTYVGLYTYTHAFMNTYMHMCIYDMYMLHVYLNLYIYRIISFFVSVLTTVAQLWKLPEENSRSQWYWSLNIWLLHSWMNCLAWHTFLILWKKTVQGSMQPCAGSIIKYQTLMSEISL